MARIRSGETDGIVVARLDRLVRAGVADALKLVEEIDGYGASIAAVDLGIDPTTPFGEFALTIMLALGRMERRRITDSWDAANRRAIERGVHFTGRTPYGYDREKGQPLTVNAETAPVVREIFERRAMKESRWSIAGWMNETHPRADGRAWTARNIEVIHSNRVYLGEAFHGKHRNLEAHPAIVTEAEYEAANAVKGGKGRTVRGEGAMLAGLIRCAGCRYAMRNTYTFYGTGEDRRKVRIYSCQGKHGSGKCPAPASVMAHLVEPLVFAHFLVMTHGTEWNEAEADTEARDEARRTLEVAESRLKQFLGDDELRETVGRDAFLEEAQNRQAAVDQARSALEAATRAVETAGRRTRTLEGEWRTMPREDRLNALRMVLDTVYVKKGRTAIDGRVMILWDGEDTFERPVREGMLTTECDRSSGRKGRVTSSRVVSLRSRGASATPLPRTLTLSSSARIPNRPRNTPPKSAGIREKPHVRLLGCFE